MGTRADFYVGVGKNAEWLGSVAYDGYEWDEKPDSAIMSAKTEQDFRAAVLEELNGRDDATLPEHGWPWPWKDSNTTGYVYAFGDGRVRAYAYTYDQEWPDMTAIQNVCLGKRSGLLVLRVA